MEKKQGASKKIIDIPAFERRLYFAFALVVTVLGTAFWLLFSNYRNAASSAKWVEHTWNVLYQGEKLNQQYKDMVSETRAFVVTGNGIYKNTFESDTITAWKTFVTLRNLTKDNNEQQDQLCKLQAALQQRIVFSVKLIHSREKNNQEECSALMESAQREEISQRIDELIGSVQAREQALLKERTETSERSGKRVFIVIWVMLAVLVLILIFVLYVVINTTRLRASIAEELKKAEVQTEISRGEQRYREALDNMLEGVQIIDREWRYIYANNALLKQSMASREELIGHRMEEVFPGIENTELFRQLRECMQEKKSRVMENEFTFPDGSMACFELSIQPVPEGLFILSIDITEKKKAGRELKKLADELEQKVIERTEQLTAMNAELESFSYSVSHDLRAPLRAISGYSTILSEDYNDKLDEEGKRVIKVIQDNVQKMGQLINDLLAFSRMGKHELNKSEVNMNKLVEGIIKEQTVNNPSIKAEFTVKPLEKVFADESMIRQAMTNLISNAIKYSSKKEQPNIEIGCYTDNNSLVYYVKDNGEGFSMDYYDKLFGVFQRLHDPKEYEGTGVGLALVKRIITRHSGQVWAEAKVKEGATFYFSLPKKSAA